VNVCELAAKHPELGDVNVCELTREQTVVATLEPKGKPENIDDPNTQRQ
jgi:hypothetical protein